MQVEYVYYNVLLSKLNILIKTILILKDWYSSCWLIIEVDELGGKQILIICMKTLNSNCCFEGCTQCLSKLYGRPIRKCINIQMDK